MSLVDFPELGEVGNGPLESGPKPGSVCERRPARRKRRKVGVGLLEMHRFFPFRFASPKVGIEDIHHVLPFKGLLEELHILAVPAGWNDVQQPVRPSSTESMLVS